jgi:hypothetical protein
MMIPMITDPLVARRFPFVIVLMAAAVPVILRGSSLASAQCTEEQKLTARDAAPSDWFGESLDLDASTAVVGAYGNGCCGAAYVFRRGQGGWVQEQKLKASDQDGYDVFGWSVAVNGDRALVEALWDDCADGGSNCGAAYVFRHDGANWVQEQKLRSGDGSPNDDFGYRVALNGDVAVIGARRDDWGGGTDRGSAYVFRNDAGAWNEVQRLTASDGRAGDWFGDAVAAGGDTVVVGAYGDDCDGEGYDCGSAYVFRFDGADWVQEQKLRASDARPEDWFGDSVAIGGDVLVIGGRHVDCQGGESNCGAAYVFRDDGHTWIEKQKLTTSDAASGDQFGRSVAISGNTIVVDARLADCDAGTDCGAAYVYRYDGVTWFEERKLTASGAAPGDWFGHSVSVSGDTAVVAAVNHDCETGGNCGAAYAFDLACGRCIRNPQWVCDGDVDGNGVVNPVDAGLIQAAFCTGEDCSDDVLCQYDLDCNGAINPVDSGIVQLLFGTCDPPRDVCP